MSRPWDPSLLMMENNRLFAQRKVRPLIAKAPHLHQLGLLTGRLPIALHDTHTGRASMLYTLVQCVGLGSCAV